MSEPLPPEIEALALRAIETEISRRVKTEKAVIGQHYPDGRHQAFRSPLNGAKLGTVYRTDPDPYWTIADQKALHDHLRKQPENLISTWEIADEQAAVEVLREHAPHLLAEVTVVNPEAITEMLNRSKASGVAAAPGIEQTKPSGTLTVKPADGAFDVVGQLVKAGVLTWDGRRALDPAAEAAS